LAIPSLTTFPRRIDPIDGIICDISVEKAGFAYTPVKAVSAKLPENVGWRKLQGLSLLFAIGFTMSLFIGNLAFADPAQADIVKPGVLAGSLVAALAGFFLIRSSLSDDPAEDAAAKQPIIT
jgi:NhaA family Na+:H+ antiporter